MRERRHPEIARISEVVLVMRARYQNSHGVEDYENGGAVGHYGRNLAKYGGHFCIVIRFNSENPTYQAGVRSSSFKICFVKWPQRV